MPCFDHCYTADKNHRFLARLGRAGFALDKKSTEHPGKHICRFIAFATPGASTRQFLEFISKPAKSTLPGLSFGNAGKLDDYFKAIRGNRFLRPLSIHRNYDWKTSGTRERRLGWNFIQFKRKYSGAHVWFTEYERENGKKPVWDEKPVHANGALGIVGLHFEVGPSGRRYFDAILGREAGAGVTLECGTILTFSPARKNRFRFVIVKSASFRKFRARAKPDTTVEYRGRPAALFKNPSGTWDILVV